MRRPSFKMRRRWIGVAINLGGLSIAVNELVRLWLGSA